MNKYLRENLQSFSNFRGLRCFRGFKNFTNSDLIRFLPISAVFDELYQGLHGL